MKRVPLERQTHSSAVCDISNSRDKIQERFVELLAQAAARAAVPVRPEVVDESRLCGSPGKIVDVRILEQLLRLPPAQQVFYGPGICRTDVSCLPHRTACAVVRFRHRRRTDFHIHRNRNPSLPGSVHLESYLAQFRAE